MEILPDCATFEILKNLSYEEIKNLKNSSKTQYCKFSQNIWKMLIKNKYRKFKNYNFDIQELESKIIVDNRFLRKLI